MEAKLVELGASHGWQHEMTMRLMNLTKCARTAIKAQRRWLPKELLGLKLSDESLAMKRPAAASSSKPPETPKELIDEAKPDAAKAKAPKRIARRKRRRIKVKRALPTASDILADSQPAERVERATAMGVFLTASHKMLEDGILPPGFEDHAEPAAMPSSAAAAHLAPRPSLARATAKHSAQTATAKQATPMIYGYDADCGLAWRRPAKTRGATPEFCDLVYAKEGRSKADCATARWKDGFERDVPELLVGDFEAKPQELGSRGQGGNNSAGKFGELEYVGVVGSIEVITKLRAQCGRNDLVILYVKDNSKPAARLCQRLAVSVTPSTTVERAFQVVNIVATEVVARKLSLARDPTDAMKLRRDELLAQTHLLAAASSSTGAMCKDTKAAQAVVVAVVVRWRRWWWWRSLWWWWWRWWRVGG